MLAPSTERRLFRLVALCAAVLGGAMALHYAGMGLTLSHYDAKAHLVVARRVFDSLTPGWKQVGAVWLPLPHLLNLLPVQIDVLYRTGLSGVAMSVGSFALAVALMARLIARTTGSWLAALAAAAVLASDPNVLYLQSTPMTEPLLFALLVGSALAMATWTGGNAGERAWLPGLTLSMACMTRYEAWPVTAALLGLGWVVLVRRGAPWRRAAVDVGRIAVWPVVTILLFIVNSRVSTGSWFVTGGFFVPENDAQGRPLVALGEIWRGLVEIGGLPTVLVGVAGMAMAVWWFVRDHTRAHTVIALALASTAALPFYAFVNGHPFRVRYMVVLVLAVSAGCGFAVAAVRHWVPQVALLVALAVAGPLPLDAKAPMVLEAQWDRPASRARRAVTGCLQRDFVRPRDKVLASMGSLAHYMQELSWEGFRLDDFVHEGTDDIWPDAVDSPKRHVQWILFDERSEGGDALTHLRERFPEFVDGFERMCEGGGVALYRKVPRRDVELPVEESPETSPAPVEPDAGEQ